jgi:hypothetical protein
MPEKKQTLEIDGRSIQLVATDSVFLSVGFSQARYPKGSLT